MCIWGPNSVSRVWRSAVHLRRDPLSLCIYAPPSLPLLADYVFGERKFGGNAQAITKNRWLHHTSLLWDFADARMALLKHPSKVPEYRAVSSFGAAFTFWLLPLIAQLVAPPLMHPSKVPELPAASTFGLLTCVCP